MNMCTYSFLIVVCPSPPHLRASSSSSWGEGVSPNSLSARHCAEHLICIISCSVQLSDSVMFNSLRPHGLQHTRLPCPSPTPRAHSNSCPLSQRCHLTISSSVIPFSSRLQSFPAPGSFSMGQFFAVDGQSIGVSASASVLPMNIQTLFSICIRVKL